jgi:hypothetical protein
MSIDRTKRLEDKRELTAFEDDNIMSSTQIGASLGTVWRVVKARHPNQL